MAKRKCSDMAQLLYEMLTEVASDSNVKTFDDAFEVIQSMIPELTRDGFSSSIVEYIESGSLKATELTKKLNRIRNEPRIEKSLQQRLDDIVNYLETGTLPPKRITNKTRNAIIDDLRKRVESLNRWLKNSDPAVRKRLKKKLDELKEKIASGNIDPEKTGEYHDTVNDLLFAIEAERMKVTEQKDAKRIEEQIESLREHLTNETLPDVRTQEKLPDTPLTQLKGLREDLQRKLRKSEPAVMKRLQAAIDTIDQRLKEGNILPKQKVEIFESEDVLNKRVELSKKQAEIRQAQQDLKPKTLWRKGMKYWDALRNWFSTGEFSFVLRQGGAFAASHPIRTLMLQPKLWKSFLSEKNYYKINSDIFSSPNSARMHRDGLALSSIEGEFVGAVKEEQIFGPLFKKFPLLENVINQTIGRFDRAAVTYLNLIRAELYNVMTESSTIAQNYTKEEGKAIASYVNTATGRGSLGTFEASARQLADWIYSPRYAMSRIQLAIGHPLWRSPKAAKKAIAKEYGRMMISVAVALGLAELVRRAVDDEEKFDIEWDARSSDFAKLRFGNRRVDFLAGVGQVAVLLDRVYTGETKSTRTGKIKSIRGDVGYGQKYTSDIISDFVKYKASPLGRNFMNYIDGRTFDGPLTWKKVLEDNSLPITVRDIFEAMQEDGLNVSTGISLMSFFGTGLQVYDPNEIRNKK